MRQWSALFARFVADKGLTDKTEILVETAKGIIVPKLLDNGLVTVNMGKPRFMPSEIPFVPAHGENEDALTHIVLVGLESVPVSCVNMGNPHAVILVDNVETAPVEHWGGAIESHEQFPERVNVGFLQVEDELSVRLRVFERGVGETQACGTGACAAVVAGVRNGLLKAGTPVRVTLPGGELFISWEEGGDVQMTGPAETVLKASCSIHDGFFGSLVCHCVCCGIVGIYFSRAAVSMALGYGVIVAGGFGIGCTLVARNVGLYAYGPFVHPPFLSDNRQYFLLY